MRDLGDSRGGFAHIGAVFNDFLDVSAVLNRQNFAHAVLVISPTITLDAPSLNHYIFYFSGFLLFWLSLTGGMRSVSCETQD